MTEPATAVTDYILAAEIIIFAVLILRDPGAGRQLPARLWAFAFLTTALAAVTGGTFHGFGRGLGDAAFWLWKITVYAIGVSSLLMLSAASVSALKGSPRKILIGVAFLQFVVYAAWMTTHDDFKYVIYDYAPTMVLILLLQTLRFGQAGAAWIAAGIVISFVAAGIQQSGFSLHPRFNYNDLYHVIQMVAMYCLYRGGKALKLCGPSVNSTGRSSPGRPLNTI